MLFDEIVVLLAVATAGLVLGRFLRLPPIVAYLLAGVIAGPGVFGWVSRSPGLEQVAEIGVALLLFGIGIEFSLERVYAILPRMLAGGGAQVAATLAVVSLTSRFFGASWPVSIFVGFLVSLSSTAIVFKLLDDGDEIDAPHGQAAAGILLFQDLAVVPMILLVPVLAGPTDSALGDAAVALGSAAAALAVLLVLARFVLPRALALVARAGVHELFPIAALVAAFGTALCATRLGLSLPIGTFLAGLALSGSRYAHQVFADILPLRDAGVALFFTGIGMLFDPAILLADPGAFLLLASEVALKGLIVGAVVAILWRSLRVAVLAGTALTQIGEFSFVLVHQGTATGLVSASLEQAFLGAALVTMSATPFLVRLGQRLALIGAARPGRFERGLRDHVLLIGYGTTGQAVARVLKATGIPFVAVDLLAANVDAAVAESLPVQFGDATRRGVLDALGARHARAAVVAVGDPFATRRIVALLRQGRDGIRILARARRVQEIGELERLGADEVVPSEFETSIELFARLLRHLGVPRHVVRLQEAVIRAEGYRALRGLGTTQEVSEETRKLIVGGILESACILEGSPADGRTLYELDLRRKTGAMLLSVVRDGKPLPTPDGSTRLAVGDLLVVYGPHEAIDKVLPLFEPAAGVAGDEGD